MRFLLSSNMVRLAALTAGISSRLLLYKRSSSRPVWPQELKSAAVEAARLSTRGRGWAPSGLASSWEC